MMSDIRVKVDEDRTESQSLPKSPIQKNYRQRGWGRGLVIERKVKYKQETTSHDEKVGFSKDSQNKVNNMDGIFLSDDDCLADSINITPLHTGAVKNEVAGTSGIQKELLHRNNAKGRYVTHNSNGLRITQQTTSNLWDNKHSSPHSKSSAVDHVKSGKQSHSQHKTDFKCEIEGQSENKMTEQMSDKSKVKREPSQCGRSRKSGKLDETERYSESQQKALSNKSQITSSSRSIQDINDNVGLQRHDSGISLGTPPAAANKLILSAPADRLIRSLCWLLRQGDRQYGLTFTSDSYLYVKDVLKLPRFSRYTQYDIENAVALDSENKVVLNKDRNRWRIKVNPTSDVMKTKHARNCSKRWSQGKGFQERDSMERLSRSMARVLRHTAEELGFPLRTGGYMYVSDLLSIKDFRSYTFLDIKRVVEKDEKGRFQMEPDNLDLSWKIRATRKHTLDFKEEENRCEETVDQPLSPPVKHINSKPVGCWETTVNEPFSPPVKEIKREAVECWEDEIMDIPVEVHTEMSDALTEQNKSGSDWTLDLLTVDKSQEGTDELMFERSGMKRKKRSHKVDKPNKKINLSRERKNNRKMFY